MVRKNLSLNYVIVASALSELVGDRPPAGDTVATERHRGAVAYRNAVVREICAKLEGQPGFDPTAFRIRAGERL